MTTVLRQAFQGWQPDADASGAPVGALLRMDNLTLDERGVLALRAGSARVGTYAAAVHSLYTAILASTRYRMTGAGDVVYANGSILESAVDGDGDVAFGSHQGQVLFARGATRKKYDGDTLRNWGIPMTGAAPSVAGSTPDGATFATGATGESPAFVVNEDDGSGASHTASHGGTANGSIVVSTNATTGRAVLTKTYSAPTDFTAYSGGTEGRDTDLVSLYLYLPSPELFVSLDVLVDVNAGDFQSDYYVLSFKGDAQPIDVTSDDLLAGNYDAEGQERTGARARQEQRRATAVSQPTIAVGWSQLSQRRSQAQRVGATAGKDWTTVKAVRIVVTTIATMAVRLDTVRIAGGRLFGAYKWAYCLAYNTGTYVALSAPSPLSDEVTLQSQGAVVTAAADTSRDSQANEVWLFRMGGALDAFYRTAVATVTGTGAIAIDDDLSDADALVVDIRLERDNDRPPEDIIGIEGPYFDRTFALTSDGLVWPSRRLNPDSFSAGQAIRMAAADETPLWIKKGPGGVYIGTSKDIYRLEGDGAELPDGTLNLAKRPLNVDHPPTTDAIAQEGNLLAYLADDGWRAFNGEGTASLTGATSLLYRGRTRHGVSPVNLTTGRFRAAIAKGQLVVVTPEGTDTTSSATLYRHVGALSEWYRHTYPTAMTVVYREPDGTLLVGDVDGAVIQLDTAAADLGDPIPIVLWTKADDLDAPLTLKDVSNLHLLVDTGDEDLTVAGLVDGAATATARFTVASDGLALQIEDATALGTVRQLQLQCTGDFTTFRFGGYGVTAVPRPLGVTVWDSGPIDTGAPELTWIRHFEVKVHPAADLAIDVYMDGGRVTTVTVPVAVDRDQVVRVPVGRGVVGRQPRIVITSSAPFLPYYVDVVLRSGGTPVRAKARLAAAQGAGA
jgi:hypothetical protein